MRIRPFSAPDLPELLSLQKRALPVTGWKAPDYVGLSREACGLLLVAEQEDESATPVLAGFAASRVIGAEAELLNLAVDPEQRRRRMGRALLNESIRRVLQMGASVYYLEVRSSNEAALALYHSAGFRLQSIRKGYYSQPRENACVLKLALDCATGKGANGEDQRDRFRPAPTR